MSGPRAMRVAGGAVCAAHCLLGIVAEVVLGVHGAWLLFGLCAALSLVIALAVAPLLRRPPDDPRGGPENGGGGGAPEPPWWPEFERALRDYERRAPISS